MSVVYIAGPMSGLPEFNKPAFFAAAEALNELHDVVLNPAILPEGLAWEQYMEICIPMIMAADTVYMLKDWDKSKGALIEHEEAVKLGKKVRYEC